MGSHAWFMGILGKSKRTLEASRARRAQSNDSARRRPPSEGGLRVRWPAAQESYEPRAGGLDPETVASRCEPPHSSPPRLCCVSRADSSLRSRLLPISRMSGSTDRRTNIRETALWPRFAGGRIEQWRKKLRHVLVYFDNEQAGLAAKDSAELKRTILGVDRPRAARLRSASKSRARHFSSRWMSPTPT